MSSQPLRPRTSARQADYLVELNRKLLDMNIDEIRQRGLDGKAMGRAIRDARLKLIEAEKRSDL